MRAPGEKAACSQSPALPLAGCLTSFYFLLLELMFPGKVLQRLRGIMSSGDRGVPSSRGRGLGVPLGTATPGPTTPAPALSFMEGEWTGSTNACVQSRGKPRILAQNLHGQSPYRAGAHETTADAMFLYQNYELFILANFSFSSPPPEPLTREPSRQRLLEARYPAHPSPVHPAPAYTATPEACRSTQGASTPFRPQRPFFQLTSSDATRQTPSVGEWGLPCVRLSYL